MGKKKKAVRKKGGFLVGPEEAAQLLGITLRALQRRTKSGSIPSIVILGRLRYFRRELEELTLAKQGGRR
jgi:excisionase family DNA binding protein